MDIETPEIFQTVTLVVLTKKAVHFDQLRHWQKINVNIKLWIKIKLRTDNLLGAFKLELILLF